MVWKLLCLLAVGAAPQRGEVPAIVVDQFGYLPADVKVAVLRQPVSGFDFGGDYRPGSLEVRAVATGQVVLRGEAVPWGGGAVHAQSGDRCWWFDFTQLSAPGEYEVVDPAARRSSGPFRIGDGVYTAVLRAAVRALYYQRCGAAKLPAHAEPAFADAAPCHLHDQQDRACRPVAGQGPALDLSGGWHDAGDYNKYINFSDGPVHQLLLAYEQQPGIWPDDTAIPESGNGVPDLLDELRWQLDWFLRMQLPDGAVLHKVSVTDFGAGSPASTDRHTRRYAPATASATISACGTYAHAARVYGAQTQPDLQAYGARLRRAAELAWQWLEQHPAAVPSRYDNAGFANAGAEDDEYTQRTNRLAAAAYLYALTGSAAYRQAVDAGYRTAHLLEWGWAGPWECDLQAALLYYAAGPGATPTVVTAIREAFHNSVRGDGYLGKVTAGVEPYRAFLADQDYVWGSNGVKAQTGLLYLQARDGTPGDATLRQAAAGYLHYLHGVNPLGLVYLTTMGALGAERSCQEFYHSHWGDGTAWDHAAAGGQGPPPGYVPGGPNPRFRPDGQYRGPALVPPLLQPVQKSYRDWNTSWPENSWELTENSNGYQASYIRLLATLVPAA